MRGYLRIIIVLSCAFAGFCFLAAGIGRRFPNTVVAYTAICAGEFGNKVYVADWSSGIRFALPESAVFGRISWSPDGKQLAYTVDLHDRYAIYVRDFGTGAVHSLPQDERMFDMAPSWSPDSRSIAFLTGNYGNQIAVIDTLTNRIQYFPIQVATNFYPPIWSPDSESLAVAGYDADNLSKLYIQNIASGAVQDISPGTFYEMTYPAWSPDGRYLTFSGNKPRAIAIYVADLQTNTITQLTQNDDPLYTASAWSSNGKTIATITEDSEIHLYDPQGNLTRKITLKDQIPGLGNGYGLNQVQWSSDGSYLILHLAVNNNWVNYAFDLATGAVHLLSPHTCVNTNADWRPELPA
jgi:Tol biopolymer transport system component